MAWSYELLSADEQRLFDRLSAPLLRPERPIGLVSPAATRTPSPRPWPKKVSPSTLFTIRRPARVLAAGVAIAEQHGAYTALMVCQRTLARIYVRDGRTGEAAALLIPSALRRKASWMFLRQNIYYAISTLFEAEAVQTATVLFGAVRSSSATGALAIARMRQQLHEQLVSALGAERLEELAATGEALPIERPPASPKMLSPRSFRTRMRQMWR